MPLGFHYQLATLMRKNGYTLEQTIVYMQVKGFMPTGLIRKINNGHHSLQTNKTGNSGEVLLPSLPTDASDKLFP